MNSSNNKKESKLKDIFLLERYHVKYKIVEDKDMKMVYDIYHSGKNDYISIKDSGKEKISILITPDQKYLIDHVLHVCVELKHKKWFDNSPLQLWDIKEDTKITVENKFYGNKYFSCESVNCPDEINFLFEEDELRYVIERKSVIKILVCNRNAIDSSVFHMHENLNQIHMAKYIKLKMLR